MPVDNPDKLTIAISMLSENGHYAGTFRLARNLRARGHRVFYIGIADFRELVTAQGFEFVSFAEDLLPPGYIQEFVSSQSIRSRGIVERIKKRGKDEQVFSAYLDRILGGSLDDCLLSFKPDLLLCDTFVWYIAARALKLGIPTINLSIILSLFKNPAIPPVIYSVPPGQDWKSALLVRGAWIWMRFSFFFTKRLASVFLGRFRFPTRMHHLVGVFLEIARASGYGPRENVTYWYGEMGPRLILPEIVFCPETFQFPSKPDDGRMYLGYPVDAERKEDSFKDADLDKQKPLVYCSLGSSAFLYPHAERFFNAFIGLSRLRSEWQFVLHTGDYRYEHKLDKAGPNLLIRKRVPQLELLRRAAVMITHGGLNSIMECIHFGVPMVIVPGMRDQPGNSARAVGHGIAVTASMSRVTAAKLEKLCCRTMDDEGIKENIKAMHQKISREQNPEEIIRFIESYAIDL